MTEEMDLCAEELKEEDTSRRLSNIMKILKNVQRPDCETSVYSNETVPFVKLPCCHRIPADYGVAWFKSSLKLKNIDFSCPFFDEVQKRTCGAKLSYQDFSQLISLEDEQRQFLEENLAILAAKRLFDFKYCPGCQSYVERLNRNNICVHCTVCSANMKRSFYFCWICRKEWKGQEYNGVQCENDGCGQRLKKPNALTSCKPEFKEDKLKKEGEAIYHMNDKPDRKRLALIINNVDFRNTDSRAGAEKDEQCMEQLLQTLDYTVVTLRDLSAQGMRAAMRDFAGREEHTKSDSCFVVFMSHGGPSGLSGIFDSFTEGDEEDIFSVDEIFDSLNTLHCSGLRDKPKIIIIQACRGDKSGSVDVEDSVRIQGTKQEHREKDFCCFRSSTPGH